MTTTRSQIMKLAKSRTKRGITSSDIQEKLLVSRSTASAALTELANAGALRQGDIRKSPITGKYQNVYFAYSAA